MSPATVEELETKITNLEAQMAQALDVSSRHGDEHGDEGLDPMLNLNTLKVVATASLLPATTETPTIFYVTGPPLQLFLVDSTGQRELGYSEEQRLTGGDLALLGGFNDVPGCSITLPVAGSYVIIANAFCRATIAAAVTTLRLLVDDTVQNGTAQTAIESLGATSQITRAWRVTTTAADEIAKLQATGLGTELVALFANLGDTSIVASGFLGGGQTAASHQHTHAELTGVGTSDHHVKYTDAEALAAVPHRIYQAL